MKSNKLVEEISYSSETEVEEMALDDVFTDGENIEKPYKLSKKKEIQKRIQTSNNGKVGHFVR